MPLIIICGIPSSGKTIRSNQIKNYFIDKFKAEEKSVNVNLINDENLGIAKDSYQGNVKYVDKSLLCRIINK